MEIKINTSHGLKIYFADGVTRKAIIIKKMGGVYVECSEFKKRLKRTPVLPPEDADALARNWVKEGKFEK